MRHLRWVAPVRDFLELVLTKEAEEEVFESTKYRNGQRVCGSTCCFHDLETRKGNLGRDKITLT